MFTALILAIAVSGVCEHKAEDVFLPGVVSTADAHEGIDWAADDGTQIFFTRAAPDFSQSKLMQARKINAEWTVDQVRISGGAFDAGLSISPNLKHMLFTSTRAGDGSVEGDWNIWRADASRQNGEWVFGVPALMPTPVNSTNSECCVVHGEKGEFYFSSNRGGSWDIYNAKPTDRGYEVVVLAGEINTKEDEWPSGYIAQPPTLLFSSIRKSGAGGDDIYISHMSTSGWSSGVTLGPRINKLGYEDSARLFHGRFFWSSRPVTSSSTVDLNVSNIYTMPTACIDELD